MSSVERLTITMTRDMAAMLRSVVEGGDYVSASEVVRDALREWKLRRQMREQEIEALREFLAPGLADIEAGRTVPFDPEVIKKRGRERLARKDDN